MIIARRSTRWYSHPFAIAPTALIVAIFFCLAALFSGAAHAAESGEPTDSPSRVAVQLSLEGAIGPASADYVVRALRRAAEQGAAVVILQIDTPGGLDTSMREIVRAILASPVPVLGYVAPSGARAASAGTFILYACHIAAMAPGTNLGAATPVAIGGFPSPQPAGDDNADDSTDDADKSSPKNSGGSQEAGKAKAINDAIAYIRSLAELRGRNADWAESAVREAASLSAGEALKQRVIELIAPDLRTLLSEVDGRTVSLSTGEVMLDTGNLDIRPMPPGLRSQLLGALSHPNVAVILLMIGIYGLIFEFMNPGALYPGTIGAICLLLGLFALSALPLNYAGLALLILGLGLMVAEAFAPSFGVLGVGGVIAFIIGSMLLVDTDEPAFAVSLPLMAGVAVTGLVVTLLIARLALKSWRHPVVSGVPQLLHARARVLDWHGARGHVLVEGERWQARGPEGLQPDQWVEVRAVEKLVLTVAPALNTEEP